MNKIRYLSLLMLLFSSIALWGNSAPPSSPYMRTQDGETLLTVVADPPEGGTVSGGGSYVAGTQVNLRATANTNFQFVNWTLNGEEISTERNFTYTKKDADETLIAHFVYNPKDPNEPTEPVKQTRLDVVADPMDGGSVSGGGKFATGAQVSLKASPNTGFVFVNWTRKGEKVSTERNFTYSKEDGDETLIAHFAYQPGNPNEPNEPDIKPVAKKYKLTVVSEEGGTNVSGSGEYVSGTQVTLSVSISTGFSFQGWYNESDSLLSTSTRFSYTTQERDETITARIKYTPNNPSEPEEPNLPSKPKPHKITVLAVPSDGGSVSVGSETVVEGEQTRVRATANTGFVFQGWYVADTLFQTAADFYYTMGNKDISMEARFVYNPSSPGEPEETGKKSYTLYLTSVRGLPGRTVQYPIYLSSQDSLTNIQFNITFPIGLTPDIENIKLSGKAQGYTLSCKEVEVTTDETQGAPRRAADRETAYQFTLTDGKLPACNTRLMVIDVAISENVTDTTQQVKINQVTVTDTEGTNTTASTRNGAVVMNESSGDGTYYYLTLISTGSGQATVNSRTVRNSLHIFDLLEGSSTNVYFTPDNGYHIDKVTLDEVDITDQVLESSRYLFSNVNADATLTVMFAEGSSSAYDLTLKTDGHGKISYNGIDVGSDEKVFSVSHGAHVEMIIMPDEGYHVKQVLLNDTIDVTLQVAEGQYVIESMTTANKVFASFEENPTVVTPLIVRNGNKVAISTTTENAVIYYTLDGSEPTNQSTLYTDSITVERNCIIKAIALRENYYPSQVATFEVDWFKVADVTFEPNGHQLTLATETENATVHYSLSTGESGTFERTGVLTLKNDCVVEAYATRDGYTDSEITKFEFHVGVVTVVTPVIVANKPNRIGISTTTELATIYYTMDGSIPDSTSTVYTDSIIVESNCTIKAIAMRENYYPSQVATFEVDWFKVADVTFAQNGRKVALATTTANASVYYKIGEGDLDVLYTDMLTLDGSCTIRATAKRDGYKDADVTSYEFNADSVTVAKPVFARKDSIVTISTETPEAVIHYTLDGTLPTGSSAVYEKPIVVEQNGVIKAIALRDNWFDSEIASLTIDRFKCEKPVIAWNGDELTASTTTEDAIIQYTLTQSGVETLLDQGGEASPLKITVNQDVTIHLYAVKTGWSNSDTLVVDYPYTAWSELLSAIQECTVVVAQCGGNSKVDQQKVQTLQNLCALANTMYNERVASSNEILSRCNELNALAAELLQQLNAIDYVYDSVGVLTINGGTSVAEALEAAGGRAEVAKTITAIVWNNTSPLTNSDLQGLDNPNLLIYVNDASVAPDRDNVIINGRAKNIVLTDTKEGNGNFYCPQAFTAEKVSYAREFRQQTQVGVSRGWESIALPFNVQTITHEKQGVIAPFGNSASTKHFWLRRLGDSGLTQATAIEANVPYVISMPNDAVNYAEEFNLSGRVTFTAQEVTIPVTEPVTLALADSTIKMVPAFQSIGRTSDVWAINVGETRGKYFEGSVFERDYREVRPFEAYTVHTNEGSAPRFVPVMEISGTTGIEDVRGLMSNGRGDKWYDLNGRRLQQKPTQKGVYLNNGRKVIIR